MVNVRERKEGESREREDRRRGERREGRERRGEKRKRRVETDAGKIERVGERSERRMTPRGNLGATSMYHGS